MDRWVFGYGSLIWRPAFSYRERRRAWITGFRRRFWQASTDHRGTREAPGRVVTLVAEPGAICAGIAFRVSPEDYTDALRVLDLRESGGYERHRVPIHFAPPGCETRSLATVPRATSHAEAPLAMQSDPDPARAPAGGSASQVAGWVYIASCENPHFIGPTAVADIALVVATACGPSGPNTEYVLRLADALRGLGVVDDDETFTLEALLTRP